MFWSCRNPKLRIVPSKSLSGTVVAAFNDVDVEDPDIESIQGSFILDVCIQFLRVDFEEEKRLSFFFFFFLFLYLQFSTGRGWCHSQPAPGKALWFRWFKRAGRHLFFSWEVRHLTDLNASGIKFPLHSAKHGWYCRFISRYDLINWKAQVDYEVKPDIVEQVH